MRYEKKIIGRRSSSSEGFLGTDNKLDMILFGISTFKLFSLIFEIEDWYVHVVRLELNQCSAWPGEV